MLILALSIEHNISISALCKILKMPRSSFYYQNTGVQEDPNLVNLTKKIFKKSGKNYGTRKLKVELSKENYQISRSRIARIMSNEGLVSNYTKTSYRPLTTKSVKTDYPNIVNQNFDNRNEREVMVSDTAYVWINSKWHYLCIIVDLCGRFIDGFSISCTKDAALAQKAIFSIQGDLRNIKIFHSDKGSEFINKLIDKTLFAFDIQRSTSGKGNAYDNAVAEAMFKIIRIEFLKNRNFNNLKDFNSEFSEWVKKYNYERIHGSLGYLTPIEFRKQKKGVEIIKVPENDVISKEAM
jgi:transposase InsO family protein